VQLTTLGGLALEGSALTRPKPLLVLTYLTLEGAAPRRTLAELFFGDAADPRDSLSTALRHLRAAGVLGELPDERLGSLVEADATRLLRDFDAYRYQAVVDAYVGAFLDGLEVGLGVEAEEWLFATREAIAGRVRTASVHAARAALVAGRSEDARRHVTRAVSHSAAGEVEADELETIVHLASHLKLPEAAALRALAAGYGIVPPAGDVGSGPRIHTASTSLHRSTRFVGRGAELTAVLALFDDPETRLTTLFGLGGVGKTRLAVKLTDVIAQRKHSRFTDGILMIALESVERHQDLVASVAGHAGLPPTGAVDVESLADALRSTRMLIVLDNVEHLDGVSDLISRLLKRCPGIAFLVTSRRRLGLEAERALEVPGLSTGVVNGAPSDAATLFCDRAARVGVSFENDECASADIEVLCTELDGHPLAIELAAAMTRILDLKEIRNRVSEGLEVLDSGPVDAPPRHRALRAALDPTWSLIDDRDRSALRCLSLFRGSFSLDAAAAVAAVALPQLIRLVDRALLRSQAGGRGRFALHPLVRSYARERTTQDEATEVGLRHREFFARLLATTKRRMEREAGAVVERLSADLPNIVQAARNAFDAGATQTGISMMIAVVADADLLQARGPNTEVAELAERAALEAERLGDWAAAERLVTKLANAQRLVDGGAVKSVPLYRRALSLAQRGSDTARQAMLHAILGAMLSDLGDNAAEADLVAAQRIAADANDDLAQCEVLGRLAYVAGRRRDWVRARQLAIEAVIVAERLSMADHGQRSRAPSLLFFSLTNLGTFEDELGDVEASLGPRLRALDVAITYGQRRWEAYARHDIARALVSLDRHDDARSHVEAAWMSYGTVQALDDQRRLADEAATWGIPVAADAGPSR
jgi:predicted ATPase